MSSVVSHSQGIRLDDLSPMMLADVMLLELISRGYGVLRLEPQGDQHDLIFDGGGHSQTIAELPNALAQATLHRLAFVAGVAPSPPTVGRIRICLASHSGTVDVNPIEALLSLRAAAGGLACEIYPLTGTSRDDDSAAVSGIPGVPIVRAGAARYEVVGELGRGGMGIVYRALHTALNKQVALKVLSPAIANRKSLAAQFVIEGRAACRARHPSIVDVTDFGRLADGRNYLVMELIEWPTLAEELERGSIATPRVLKIARNMAHGLAAAHRHGVVHRDLKPANVFVSADAEVKIGDFGLAYSADLGDENLAGMQFGTVPYMSPEFATGSQSGVATDIYSFGCILHELLSGDPPYGDAPNQQTLDLHREAPIPELSREQLEQCPALGDLHRALLAKSPADRPASFDVVVNSLQSILEGLL